MRHNEDALNGHYLDSYFFKLHSSMGRVQKRRDLFSESVKK